MNKNALLAGTFDPITFGHIDLIKRSIDLFGNITIGVSTADGKNPLLNLDDRIEVIKQVIDSEINSGLNSGLNIKVKKISGLLVDFINQNKFDVFVRGVRNAMDTQYELDMLQVNRSLNKKNINNYETVFLYPAASCSFISSSRVREILKYGGDISSFVPEQVVSFLHNKAK